MHPRGDTHRGNVQAQHGNPGKARGAHTQPGRLRGEVGGERIQHQHNRQQGQQHVVVRPANRRKRHHERGGHRHLRQGRATAFQLVQQAGGEHDAHERQSVVDGLRGTLGQAEVQQPTLNRNVIHIVQAAHARRVRQRREPEFRCLLGHQNEAQRNRGGEGRTQGCDALPIAAHQQDEAEHERSELHAAGNADQHAARHAGRRAHKIGQNQRGNERVDLNQVDGALPGTRRNHQKGQHGDSAHAAKVPLQGQFATARIDVVVDDGGKPPGHCHGPQHHEHLTDDQGHEREGQEQHRGKRRVGERRLNHAVIVQGRGVQVLGEPLVIENGHGAQAVNGEIHAAGGVAQDSEQEIGAHRQER